jgi:hypothetical protein
MPEISRTRDLIIFKRGDCYAVAVSPSLAQSGWIGGQGVQWFDSGKDELAVEATDGDAQGWLIWGSNESSDQFTAMTRNQPTYEFAVIGFGGWLYSTVAYEKYTWASRQVGPLVEIVYQPQDQLVYSLRGFLTNEDEWTLSGDPRAPNDHVMGVVVQSPSLLNNYYLTVQARL